MTDFGFEKIKRGANGEVTQNQLYVTYDQICQCDCPGCRNKGLPQEEMETNRQALNRVIIKEAESFRHIIFGGGEPLYQLDNIVALIKKIKRRRERLISKIARRFKDPDDDRIIFTMTTNGQKEVFTRKFDKFCKNCRHFNRIILSRYHYDDKVNDGLFRANGSLMTTENLKKLCAPLRDKMQLSCICQKGGIETADDMIRYIEWAHEVRIYNIMFSNYQQDITPDAAKKAGCDLEEMHQVQMILTEEYGFELVDTFVFSAGYKISKYRRYPEISIFEKIITSLEIARQTGITDPSILLSLAGEVVGDEENITITFREFLSPEEFKKEWERAKKKTNNYSVMPNGAMYADWSCKDLI